MVIKSIKIGGHTFKVLYTTLKDSVNDDLGNCDTENNCIRIRTDVAPSLQESTLLHEILEAINSMNELKLEHKTITILETNLYQVLKENKLWK